ncbi:MAG: DNA-3-methyladenine glycosylase 2 family protein [Clostridia bacterium]|nr:DNA-3-methyladenine glycosylase 2 family protein [Clostridia bacterium]
MFTKTREKVNGRDAIVVRGLGPFSLSDTLRCGQCFRFEEIPAEEGLDEYLITVGRSLIDAGQRERGELILFGMTDGEFDSVALPFFSLESSLSEIKEDILRHTDSEWLKNAAELGAGIAILRQEPWETLLSFIISQNNNIPRIKKIIKQISAEYGVNITLQNGGSAVCPLGLQEGTPCEEKCRACGICYTFPRPEDIVARPERLLVSRPGFRYGYMCDAAERVLSGEVNLDMIAAARSYTHTVEALKKIRGVGDKVAACVALFGFSNLEAFPIDVWMKRAIDLYFDGSLDPATLGRYAGVAQQYIFHYIRNVENS